MTVSLFACDYDQPEETSANESQTVTEEPSEKPDSAPTDEPSAAPSTAPTDEPTQATTQEPTQAPTQEPTEDLTQQPTQAPTQEPTEDLTQQPTRAPTQEPTEDPTEQPTQAPTQEPTEEPTEQPTQAPTQEPTEDLTQQPTQAPTQEPTEDPTEEPTEAPNPRCPDGTCQYKSVKGVPTCKICGNPAECLGVHDYTANEAGHWKPECEHCGKAAGNPQNHEYTEYVEDEGDLFYYSYVCDICYYVGYEQEVPYEINLFYPASEIANSTASSGIEGVYNFVSGVGFGRFERPSGVAGANCNVTIEDASSIDDDPVGKYMAVRLRLPRSQTSISIQIKSVHADDSYTYKISGLKPGWITLAIDLSKMVKTNANGGIMGYVADQYDEYYVEKLCLSTYINSTEALDISYVLFCEEKEDLMSFVANDTNCYFYEDVTSKAPEISNGINCQHNFIIDEEKGTHTLENPCFECGMGTVFNEEHSYVEIIGGGKNSYECSVCGYAKYLKLVPESVNKYVSASELNAGGIIYYPYTLFNHGLYIEPGDAYTRYEGPTGLNNGKYFNVGQVIFARDDADVNPDNNGNAENGIRINVGDATYMVIRVRVNTPDLNPLKITVSTTAHNGGVSGDNIRITVPVAQGEVDKWQVFVIDLAKVFPDHYIPEENGDYVLDTFYFNICEGNFAPGCTLDLSYMAYCSSWEEVAAIVDEEQLFYLSDKNGGGNWAKTEDKKCVGECTLGDADITEDETAGTITYQFKCSVCGNALASKTIDQSVSRYYYAGELASTAKTYYQINGSGNGKPGQVIHDGETGRVYSRYTGFEKEVDGVMTPQTAQVLWQRAQEDMWGDQTSSTAEQYTESVGNAEWLVMRVKTNNPAQRFYLTFSTTEYNTDDAVAMGRTNGMLEIAVPLSASQSDEWTTYVVNLKDMFPAEYVKDSETGEYIIDSFYFNLSSFAVSTHLDIEYVAFVDGSWAELDKLVDEQNVVVISDKTGGHGFADVSTGECLEGKHAYGYSSVTDEEGNMINKIACAVCGDTKLVQNVSKDVNKFFDITKIGCFNQKIYNDAKVSTGHIDIENGVAFTRLTMTYGNTHLVLSGGSDVSALTKETISTGRYAVIKLRSSGNRSIAFDAQTGDHTTHSNSALPKESNVADEWMVWVIDLSAFESVEGGKGYTCGTEQVVKFRITTGDAKYADPEGSYVEGSSYGEDPFYLDIAYLAIVDSVDEAKSMITDESFTLFSNGLNNEGVVTATAPELESGDAQ